MYQSSLPALSVLHVREVLLLSVVFHRVLSCGDAIFDILAWIEGESVVSGRLSRPVCVACHVVVVQFLRRELAHECARVAAPHLTSGDQTAYWYNAVRQDNSTTLDASSGSDHRASSNYCVIIDDAAVDAAGCTNSHILSNID